MQVCGEIHRGVDVDIEIDADEIAGEMDWTSHISDPVNECVKELLGEYDGNTNPCGLGESFEQAVWWAMDRKAEHHRDGSGSGISVMKLDDSEELNARIRDVVRAQLRELVLGL